MFFVAFWMIFGPFGPYYFRPSKGIIFLKFFWASGCGKSVQF